MFHVDWKYRGENDRILLLLPPITQSLTSIDKHPLLVQKIRTTIQQLFSKESLQFIVAHVPFFESKNFKQIEWMETIYGVEVRFLNSLAQLIDRNFSDHISNECIYLVKDEKEWIESRAPWEWYFNVCIVEQLYQYYDSASKCLQEEFKYDGEVTVGANYVYDTVFASLNMTKKIPFNNGNILRSLVGINSDFNEGDIVLIVGKIGTYESKQLTKYIESYVKECRLTAFYTCGHPKDTYLELFEEHPEIKYHAWTPSELNPSYIEWLWAKLQKHGPKYNSYVFLGTFSMQESVQTLWEKLEKPLLKACIYTPESWSSLHVNSKLCEKYPFWITFEPFGLLDYFLNGEFQIKGEIENPSNSDDEGGSSVPVQTKKLNSSVNDDCNNCN